MENASLCSRIRSMEHSLGKEEKLKSRKRIGEVFSNGRKIKEYPLKIVYLPVTGLPNHQMGVSVPKRNFKKAVDRNILKRRIREAYRIQKGSLDSLSKKYAMMFIFMGREKADFQTLASCVEKIIKKLKTV